MQEALPGKSVHGSWEVEGNICDFPDQQLEESPGIWECPNYLFLWSKACIKLKVGTVLGMSVLWSSPQRSLTVPRVSFRLRVSAAKCLIVVSKAPPLEQSESGAAEQKKSKHACDRLYCRKRKDRKNLEKLKGP